MMSHLTFDLRVRVWCNDINNDDNTTNRKETQNEERTFRFIAHGTQILFCQLKILRYYLSPIVQRTLDELPDTLDETCERVLTEIKKPNQVYAHCLLQCLAVPIRPLGVRELGEVLAVELDEAGVIPKLNTDWSWEDRKQAVLSACSSLITVVDYPGGRIIVLNPLVQP
ncbi:hypothetical protein F5888DRAFT_842696 [Russula emetica]|nr:hypothetical protein F5888DRAFT_842696 [Russula emetica]